MNGLLGAAIAAITALLGAAVPSPAAPPDGERAAMQRLVESLRSEYSAPGAGFTFGDGDHEVTIGSGTADVLADDPIEADDLVRVGSDTKMFVAAVVLQLVAEGVLDLDVPIDTYVPGALRYPVDALPRNAEAFDGRTVTVRHLLQHTSGVPDYAANILYVLHPLHQLLPPTPEDLVAHGVRNGPNFRPGTAYWYSNTNYALVGMIVEAVTGRSVGAEIHERIVEPLGLHATFLPGRGQRSLPGEHVHGYLTALVPVDMSYLEPSVWGTAGGLVSSPADMNTFLSALLAGEVVPPAQLEEMLTVRSTGPGQGYGLGIVRVELSCGEAWGHGGFLAGYRTLGLATADGRHGFLTFNTSLSLNLLPAPVAGTAYDLFELALC